MASFVAPSRRITAPQHIAGFKSSPAYRSLTGFILAVNEAIKGRAMTDPTEQCEVWLLQTACSLAPFEPSSSSCSPTEFIHLSIDACCATLQCHQTIGKLTVLLDTVDQWITDTPPVPQQGRFGNVAFRTFHQRIVQVLMVGCTWGTS